VRTIEKIGLVVISDRKLLLCKPKAFPDLILPGGMVEGTEDASANLLRETREELGPDSSLDLDSLAYIGTVQDVAAGRKDTIVRIQLFLGELRGPIQASSEIQELVWFDPQAADPNLSAVVKNRVIPLLHYLRLL
jgi:ADP-ribose pyrophosphatase YjhB (NUDIX family)